MAKDFLTYEQQLHILEYDKQLTISNQEYATKKLEELSYYSLIGGYKSLFKHAPSNKYIHGVTFEELVAFYYFDEELRTLFLKYILHVERHIKSMFSYHFCEKYGEQQSMYLDMNNYNHTKKNHRDLIRLTYSLQKATLSKLIKTVLKQCPHLTEKHLLDNMGFPSNWNKISRYRKL